MVARIASHPVATHACQSSPHMTPLYPLSLLRLTRAPIHPFSDIPNGKILLIRMTSPRPSPSRRHAKSLPQTRKEVTAWGRSRTTLLNSVSRARSQAG